MFDTIYLHVGSPKTGTTSIQGSFDANRDVLERAGWGYPSDRLHYQLMGLAGSNKRVFGPGADDGQPIANFRSDCETWFRRETKRLSALGVKQLIFSFEPLFAAPEPVLREIIDRLRRKARRIVIICYCRHPYHRWAGVYQERVKNGGLPGRRSKRLETGLHDSQTLEMIESLVGPSNMILRKFDRETLINGDVIDDFAAALGFAALPADFRKSTRENESLSCEAFAIARAINRRVPAKKNGLWNPARAKSLPRLLTSISGTPFVPPRRDIDRVAPLVEAERARLKDRFGLDFAALEPPNRPALFRRKDTLDDIARIIADQAVEIERLRAARDRAVWRRALRWIRRAGGA